MKTLAVFNRKNVSEKEVAGFRNRKAVRGVIFDADENIALLHPVAKGWYGLPGGGVENGEDFEQGLIRECKEEIGCDIEILTPLGSTLEYRKLDNLINESHGYTGRSIGEKGNPLVGDETSDSVIVWVPIVQAIQLMEAIPMQENLYSQYCIERDVAFLRKAQQIRQKG